MTGRLAAIFKRIGAREEPPPWGLTTALVVYAVAFLAIFVGTFMAGAALGIQQTTYVTTWNIGGIIAAFFVLLSRRKPEDQPFLRLGAPQSSLVFILLVALALAVVVDLLKSAIVGEILPIPELLPLSYERSNIALWFLSVIFILLVQPAAEELVFQGVMLPALRKALGPWPGLILCALTFGLFHFLAYTSGLVNPTWGDVWYVLGAPILMGLILGAIRVYTGSTRAAIVAHMAFGIFAVLALLVLPTGA